MPHMYHPPANGTIASTDGSAVLSLAFGVACMITAELLRVSLLTPLARGLAISEGLAGQTVSVVALTAIVSSLLVTTVNRGIDRRTVLLVFSVVQIISCVIVAAAPTFTVAIIGRVILGLAVGGFWAMSASLAMQLPRLADVPIALSIVFGGLSASMIIMGCLPVTWSTWITRNLGDDAENAGAFQVALVQLSNVVGTAFAGAAFNLRGSWVQRPWARFCQA